MSAAQEQDLLLAALEQNGLALEEIALSPAHGWVDTGNFALNWAVSGRFQRGWPLGHMVELFGDPACGKSYLLLNAIREFQRVQGWTVLDDSEGSYNAEWATRLGVESQHIYKVHSETVKQHAEAVLKSCKSYASIQKKAKTNFGPGLLGLDSLGQLSTEHETEKGVGTRDMSKAQEVKAAFRLMAHQINKYPICYIATNHTYAAIGNIYQPRVSSSGSGLKFAAGIRLDLRNPAKLRNPSTNFVLGVGINAYVEKSRFCAPWRQVRINIPFYSPVSRYSGIIPVLLSLGVLGVTKGHTLVFEGQDTTIAAHKTDALRQDFSAGELVAKYPNIISIADTQAEYLESQNGNGISTAVEEGQESDDLPF